MTGAGEPGGRRRGVVNVVARRGGPPGASASSEDIAGTIPRPERTGRGTPERRKSRPLDAGRNRGVAGAGDGAAGRTPSLDMENYPPPVQLKLDDLTQKSAHLPR